MRKGPDNTHKRERYITETGGWNKMFRVMAALIISAVMLTAGCGAPKAVKLDGSDRVPVNTPEQIKVMKEGGMKKI
jgi:hypothetical protein